MRLRPTDQVLLVAAMVGVEHDFLDRAFLVVGDVEETAVFVEEFLLASAHLQVLPHHHHPLRLLALGRLIGELGHVLLDESDVLELAGPNDLLLHVLGPATRSGFHLVARGTLQGFPSAVPALHSP